MTTNPRGRQTACLWVDRETHKILKILAAKLGTSLGETARRAAELLERETRAEGL